MYAIRSYYDWHANWKRIAREGSGDIPVDFEIQVYKKLLDIVMWKTISEYPEGVKCTSYVPSYNFV